MRELTLNSTNTAAVEAAAAAAIKQGKIVALPTDTVYGLAVDAFNEAAVASVFKLKNRRPSKPLVVFIDDIDRLPEIASPAVLSPAARRLAAAFWPGALTLIFQAQVEVPRVGGANGTIGVRLPDSRLLRGIIKRAATLLAVTSANVAGETSAVTAAEVRAAFGGGVDLLIDGGRSPGEKPSTVVDVSGEYLKVVRRGAVGVERIKKVLSQEGS